MKLKNIISVAYDSEFDIIVFDENRKVVQRQFPSCEDELVAKYWETRISHIDFDDRIVELIIV